MTCQELLTYLSAYLDGELDESLSAAAHEHLATCTNCQVVVHTTQNVIQLGGRLHTPTLSPERRSRLFQQIQSAIEHAPQSDH